MRTEDFDYTLPPDLIAQTPVEPRDASRLLVIDRKSGRLAHRTFADLPALLDPGDLVVLNDSRVLPARLKGARVRGGGAAELLLLRNLDGDRWLCLARPAKRMHVGDKLSFGNGALLALVEEILDDGQRIVRFECEGGAVAPLLARFGTLPLPPYIHQEPDDPDRYQTVYARDPGSAAAPTAGLHFTTGLLRRLDDAGIRIAAVTLHVGLGTFRPVQTEQVEQHVMHAEFGILPAETAAAIATARGAGNRVVAVGTTTVRVLETVAAAGRADAWSGWTDIFIYPGVPIRVTDALVTNFHLPKSSLLMLVSAFAGKPLIDRAYATAVSERYRFFSFGDAMLIL